MSVSTKPGVRVCDACRARNSVTAARCWLCHGVLASPESTADTAPSPCERRAIAQFSFATLMLTVAMFAVLLGVFRIEPGLGILAAIVIIPAWLRTCIVVLLRQSRSKPVAFSEKAAVFAVSVGIVVGICVIAIAALVAALSAFCGFWALDSRQWYLDGIADVAWIVFAISSAVVVFVTTIFFWAWCRRRRRRRRP